MRLLQEPAVHFALLGGAFFLLHAWAGPPATETLRVDAALVAARQEKLFGDAPKDADLDALIERNVEERLLVAEAKRLGLDQSDPIIRRRLLQKMEFLLEDLVAARAPTDAELEALLDPQRDQMPGRIWFSHAFFPEAAHREIAAGLVRLRRGGSAGRPFSHGNRVDGWIETRVDRVFGARFTEKLEEAPVGEWRGPFPSGYGQHLVKVERRTAAREMTLAEARPRLLERWKARARAADRAALLADLRERYAVEVVGR